MIPHCNRSLADVGQKSHEAGTLDGVGGGALEGGAEPGALAAEELALARDKLLEVGHVLVVHECGTGAAFLGTEPAPVLPAVLESFANHVRRHGRSSSQKTMIRRGIGYG